MSITTYFTKSYQSGQSTLTRASRPAHPFAEGIDPAAPTVLTIKGVVYIVTTFTGDEGTIGVRLAKQAGKGEMYDVSRGADGLVKCDCPSYINTYEGTCGTCKHGTAVVEAGLLKPAKPVANRVAVEPVKSDTMSEIKSATVADSPAPKQIVWTDKQFRQAAYFKLNIPKNVVRAPQSVVPTIAPVVVEPVLNMTRVILTEPTPVEVDPAPTIPAEINLQPQSQFILNKLTDPAPTIPAEVSTIRVTEGYAAGIWHRQPKRSRWVHDDCVADLDMSDTARWLSCTCADGLFVAGMVELLPDRHPTKPATPIKPPTPPQPRIIPPALDEIWFSAFQLGRAGVDAVPCKTWTDAARLAFMDGFYWGDLQRDADHEEDAESRQEMAYA